MSQAYQRWHQSCRELAHHQQQSIEREARKQLLQYHLKELNESRRRPASSSRPTPSTSAWPTAASC